MLVQMYDVSVTCPTRCSSCAEYELERFATKRSSKAGTAGEYEAGGYKWIYGVPFAAWGDGGVKGDAAADRRSVGGSCCRSNRSRARSIFTPNFLGDDCAAPDVDWVMTANMRREDWTAAAALCGRRGRHMGFDARSSLRRVSRYDCHRDDPVHLQSQSIYRTCFYLGHTFVNPVKNAVQSLSLLLYGSEFRLNHRQWFVFVPRPWSEFTPLTWSLTSPVSGCIHSNFIWFF